MGAKRVPGNGFEPLPYIGASFVRKAHNPCISRRHQESVEELRYAMGRVDACRGCVRCATEIAFLDRAWRLLFRRVSFSSFSPAPSRLRHLRRPYLHWISRKNTKTVEDAARR